MTVTKIEFYWNNIMKNINCMFFSFVYSLVNSIILSL